MNTYRPYITPLAGLVLCLLVAGCPGENRFTGPVGGEAVAPRILEVAVPNSITTNALLRVTVSAESDRPIQAIDVTLSRALTRDTTVTLAVPREQIERRIEFQTPSQMSDSVILVRVVVRDGTATSEAVEVQVPVVEDNPSGP